MKNSITLYGSSFALIAAMTAYQDAVILEGDDTPSGVKPISEVIHPETQPAVEQPVTQPETVQQPVTQSVQQPETVQTVAPKTPTVPAGREGVDADGIPWDARIHGAGKVPKVKDMTWRLKRGVDDDTIAKVKAELKAQVAPPMPTGDQQPVTQAPVQQPVQQPVTQAPVQQPVQQPVVPPMPNGDQAQTQEPPTGLDFNGFMQNISLRLGDQKLDAPKLTGYAQELGLTAITDLAVDSSKIDQAVQIMHRDGVWFA